MNTRLVVGLLLVTTVSAFAQTPYSGMQARPIKALSEQQVADLHAGRGMGLALPAELNGYPGPSHVLEMADRINLSVEQRVRIQQLFASMKQEAVPLGLKLIEQEAELDRQFATGTVTPGSLKSTTAVIASTQGELRETHLKYHLSTVTVLTESQRQRYSELRGYERQAWPHQHHQMQR